MKGLMLFFLAFGLFATLGDTESVRPADVNVTPYVDEQVVSTEPAAVEPAVTEPAVTEPKSEESVSYDGADYEITFSKDTMESDFGTRPYLINNGLIYSTDDVWAYDGYDTRLTVIDEKTRTVKETTMLIKNDLDDIFTMFVYPAKNGGYLTYASKWTEEGSQNYFIKYDAKGNRVNMKNLTDSYKISKDGYIYRTPACDGTNFYVTTQEYDKSGDVYGGVLMLDENFNYAKTVLDSITVSICMGNDGLLYIYDCYHETLYSYNSTDDTLNRLAKVPYCGNNICAGNGDEVLVGESVLYSYNTKTGVLTELIDFSDYGYDVYYADCIYRDSNGDIKVYFEDYSGGVTSMCATLKLKK